MFENMYAMIENTTYCGADCIMCPREKFMHKKENMSFDLFKKIVDELVAGGCRKIGICGFGDSLCDSGLEKKLDYVRNSCPEMYISTINTGHLLNDDNIKMVSKYFDIVKISMYGFSKKVYESVHRGSLVFEQVKDNVDRFLEYNAGDSGVYTIMTFLVMPENEKEVEDWKAYYDPKANRIDIWKPHNWGGDEITDYSRKKIIRTCHRVTDGNDLQICTDGTVVPCCFDYNRTLKLGNVKDSSLVEIMEGEPLKRLRDAFSSGSIDKQDIVCRDCDQIRDRSDALIYSTESDMKVGKPSMINYERN